MTKQDFITKVSQKAGSRKGDVDVFMNAVREVVIEALAAEDEVKLFKGLTLCGVKVDETIRRNPQTGEPVVCPPYIKLKAKFAPSFKKEVNG